MVLLCSFASLLAIAGERVLVEGILDAEVHRFNEYSFAPLTDNKP